eukprot:7387914-Prymnesium_polylepis.1
MLAQRSGNARPTRHPNKRLRRGASGHAAAWAHRYRVCTLALKLARFTLHASLLTPLREREREAPGEEGCSMEHRLWAAGDGTEGTGRDLAGPEGG